MYKLSRETEIALMEVAVMHPNTSIDELLMKWVTRFYNEHEESFDYYVNQKNSTLPMGGRASDIQPSHQTTTNFFAV
ncbi:hypothetical protein [Thalassotalea profundi]|uniref:Uncharacterized protein n=1 Tax=Thalassotalea profundi TaxID=2036687 RepID=A0ABQ3IPC6_9GAMM|nr:hypothetical protein [Thalassotalea profundi]GHE86249.1 hypothetical protein GCM10011501_14170 [Thalassotalea profundi]